MEIQMRNPRTPYSTLFLILTITVFLLMLCIGSLSEGFVRGSAEAAPMPACPTSFTVNSLADTGDSAPGNMVCDDGAGNCTLRAAIQESNALTSCGVIDIDFSVTGAINTTSVLSITHSVNINGPGASLLTVANNNTSVVFDLPNAAPVVNLNGLTITGGNGVSLVAGGINNSSTLTLDGCHITGNAGKFAGGIQNFRMLTILNTTISNNTATLSGFNNGGGISQSNNGTLIVTNSTISGNTASANGNANGGILIFDGTATITNCTVTDNQGGASDSVGGLRRNFGSMTVRNSIVAANRNNSTFADVGGGLTSQGYNLIGNRGTESFTQTGDQSGTGAAPLDPLLDALANNGGPTPTHAIMGGSTAIDKGSSFGSATDQRGLARTFDDPGIAPAAGGDNTDIGAFEAQTLLPSLGTYPNAMVALSANATITPDQAPGLATTISVSTSTGFKGTLTASPSTGVVRVTNAHPAGTYTIRIKTFGPNGMASRTFTLTVESGTPCADPTAFVNAPDVSIGSFPLSMAIGDFNNDGHQDFVTGYDSFDPLSIRLGDGAGNFSPAADVPTDPFVRGIAVGDFNGDGNMDLAAASYGFHTVSIRLGDGTGQFTGTTNISVGIQPWSIAVGDFNEDGHLDIAASIYNTGNTTTGNVSILFGDGAGNFAGAADIPVVPNPISIVVGDFNNDGNEDFATASDNSTVVSIRLGNGAGGFTNAADINLPINSRWLVTGDFNNDGNQDIAVASESGNIVSIRLGDGTGNFTSAPNITTNSGSVETGDFNNDSNQDLAIGNLFTGSPGLVLIRLGNGTGNFTAAADVNVSANPRIVLVGDFNSDGKQDLLVVHYTNANFAAIRLNNSCPPPNTPPAITASAPLTRQQAAPAINSQIATVSDVEQEENTLMVTATPLTGTGVSVTNISVAANGSVTADVAAACGATTSTFTLTVTDDQMATATATLTVNVTPESTLPTLTCPSNISQSTDSGLCSAVVNFTTPTANDNCPGATVVCSPATGSTFPTGTTTVTCTATDAAGNTASCSFTVTVDDTESPSITCPENVTQGTDSNQCSAVVTYTTPTAGDNCPGVGAVTCSPASGSTFPTGTTTVSCSATDAAGNNGSCSFTVTVNDTESPSITCPSNVVTTTDPAQCSAVVTYSDPAVSDNCSGVGSPVCNPPSGSTFPQGVTTVNCAVSDSAGNSSNCQFTITVNDDEPPTVACPSDILFTTPGPSDSCGVVDYLTPKPSDNCSADSIVCSPASGFCFPLGMTTVTCTATDLAGNTAQCSFKVTVQNPCVITCPANITTSSDVGQCGAVATFAPTTTGGGCGTVSCSPASGSFFPKGTTTVSCTTTTGPSCSFTVTINDNESPTLSCPSNIVTGNDAGQCSAIVNYSTPSASDNCPGAGAVTCSPSSGSTFPKGTTTVTCSVSDASGNNASCSFTVTVNDTESPTPACPANITQDTDSGLCTATVSYATPKAGDNCPGVGAVNCSPAYGSAFSKGVTTVTCSATDASGNIGSCSFTVTVNDTQTPTITCPANMTRPTDSNLCSAVVAYSAPSVSDNCPGVGAPVCTPASGSTFPKGVTTVSCTVTDASSNQSSCSFTVTVNDTQLPAITCPPNQTRVALRPSDTTVVANYPAPVFSDNCPGAGVVCNPPSGSAFPVGTTTVTCTVTDAAGNQAGCSFTVTVFDVCLQDDSSAATVILFNSFTGDYLFCCDGTTYAGAGTVQKQGSIYTLTHNTTTRRVTARFDGTQYKGTASLQSPIGTTRCSITDRDTRNNTCSCATSGQ